MSGMKAKSNGAVRMMLMVPVVLGLMAPVSPARAGTTFLNGHIPVNAVAQSRILGRWDSNAKVKLSLTLPLRNQNQLAELIQALYNQADPRCGQFLTGSEFADQFGPTQADYDAVIAFATGAGLTVDATHTNRALV